MAAVESSTWVTRRKIPHHKFSLTFLQTKVKMPLCKGSALSFSTFHCLSCLLRLHTTCAFLNFNSSVLLLFKKILKLSCSRSHIGCSLCKRTLFSKSLCSSGHQDLEFPVPISTWPLLDTQWKFTLSKFPVPTAVLFPLYHCYTYVCLCYPSLVTIPTIWHKAIGQIPSLRVTLSLRQIFHKYLLSTLVNKLNNFN